MFQWFEVIWTDCDTEAWTYEISGVFAFSWVSLAYSLISLCFSWFWMILCFYCSTSCFFALYECCLFLDKLSLHSWKVLPLLFISFVAEFCLSDLCATSWSLWCLVLLSDFMICVLAVLVIPLSYTYNLLKMMFLLWFHFVCYCIQTVLSAAVVLSCFDFYWCSVLSTFQLFGSYICSAHLFVNGMSSTFFNLFWVLLWVFLKTCLWTVCFCW